jgi:hypothetical protein
MSFNVPSSPRRTPWPETIRIVILIATAVAIMSPLLTSNIIGGVDARWYAYMLADYIEQVRLGHVLVTVGQGPFAWNGSVHLFRSAPVYMAVARVWDFLTFRQLNAFALQHLTVISSAVAGALGFYAAAVRIIPNRRWMAAAIAILYLSTPSWLSTVLRAEAYMSYMAFAALPIVLYGNARTVLKDDGRGYITLAAGLALVWMCHPPIAFISTTATLVIQSGLIMSRGIVSWKNLAAGACTFAVLGAYYFTSMSELPPLGHARPQSSEMLQIVGFALFFVGIGRCALVPRPYGWGVCAAAGLLAEWKTDHSWMCWAVGTGGIWLGCVIILRVFGRRVPERHAFAMLFMSVLAGAALAEAWVGRDGIFLPAIMTLSENTAAIREIFAPLVTPMRPIQIFQPGWGLIAVLSVSILSLFGSRPLGAKLFFAVSLGLALCFLRFPLVSNFLDGRFPIDFSAMCGWPLPLRLTPVWVSFIAMSGVLWVATLAPEDRKAHGAVGLVLGLLVLWAGSQTLPFLRHTHAMTGDAKSTAMNLRPENAKLDAYAYLLLPIPPYFSHGKTDPMLESRLLDDEGRVLVGPTEDALIMERHGVQKVRLTTAPMPNAANWVGANPSIAVEPKEHSLLRFEFDPAWNYAGYFILAAENSYREYHLPDSGQASGFGIGGSRTSVLSIWNTGATTENYKFSLSCEPGNNVPHVGALFANVYVSKLDPSALPIRLESFIPYRASVTSAGPGTLETFRAYMPGYRATVDGKRTPVFETKERLVALRVPGGSHEVELRFAGTAKLWLAASVSFVGWLGLLVACAFPSVFQRRLGIA